MATSLLKRFDPLLFSSACTFAAALPKRRAGPHVKPLVVRPGGLGDLVCADIALQELGRDARDFLWLIEKRSRPWATWRGLPFCCYDVDGIGTGAKILGRHAQVINSEQLFGLAQATALLAKSKEGQLVSFATNRGARWSDRTVPYDWDATHETISFTHLFAAALDLPEGPATRAFRPRLQPANASPLVLIAGRQSASRRLPLEVWTAQISRWHGSRPFEIASAPEDDEFADQLAAFFPQAARFHGDFQGLCERIASAEELFTVDGGGVHIASYFGVPTLAIFTSGRDRKWHPLGEGSRIVRRHDLACQPCTKFGQVPPCPNAFACREVENLEPESCLRSDKRSLGFSN